MTHYIELKHFHLYISHNKLEVKTIERFIVSSWNITVHMLWHSLGSGIWDFHRWQELLAAFVWMTRWNSSCDRHRDHRRRRLWDFLQGATGRQLLCRKDNGKEPEVESRRTGSSKGNYHRITGWEPAKTDLWRNAATKQSRPTPKWAPSVQIKSLGGVRAICSRNRTWTFMS